MAHDCFSLGQLETLCKALADTNKGLNGSEIGHLLANIGVDDTDPSITKWKRLFNALANRQNNDKNGDRTLAFIHKALDPVTYSGNRDLFEERREKINVCLAFYGLQYEPDGKFHRQNRSTTLSEAEERASTLKCSLLNRNVNKKVLEYCKAELLEENYFHAVLEATKSIFDRLRNISGSTNDGGTLVDELLCGDKPKLIINNLAGSSEQSEQKGFANLLKGLYGTFRNPTAHSPRISWEIKEEDALDLLSIATYVHRRIDNASFNP